MKYPIASSISYFQVFGTALAGLVSGWILRKWLITYGTRKKFIPLLISANLPDSLSLPVANHAPANGPQTEFVEVLTFPDQPAACPAMEMYGRCSKFRCPWNHSTTGSDKLKNYLRNALESVDLAAQVVTSHQIADILAELAVKGVRVRVIRDYDNLLLCKGTQHMSKKLTEAGAEMRVNGRMHKGSMYVFGIFHHKFILIDNRILITASLNFTLRAVLTNFEWCVITNTASVVEAFAASFDKMWCMFTEVSIGNL